MNKSEIIAKAYKEFASFERPIHFTDYKHCEECKDHDQTMQSSELRNITTNQVGNISWSPLPFLTEQALGYVMPRLIEMALNLETNPDDDIFIYNLLLTLTPKKKYERFNNYSIAQIKVIQQSLNYIKTNYTQQIEESMCDKDLEQAIENWN